MDLLTPNVGLIFWTALTFILLLLILKKLAWKPILEALDARERRIKESLDKAAAAQRDAEKTLAEYRKMLEQARQEAQEIINRSRKTAETTKEEILAKSQEEAQRLLQRAKREITLEREKAIEEIKRKAVDLSLAMASKVIRKSLTPENHRELIEQSLEEMGELS